MNRAELNKKIKAANEAAAAAEKARNETLGVVKELWDARQDAINQAKQCREDILDLMPVLADFTAAQIAENWGTSTATVTNWRNDSKEKLNPTPEEPEGEADATEQVEGEVQEAD